MPSDPARLALAKVYRWKAAEVRVPRPLELAGTGADAPVPVAQTPYQRPPVTLREAAKALKVTEVMLVSWLPDPPIPDAVTETDVASPVVKFDAPPRYDIFFARPSLVTRCEIAADLALYRRCSSRTGRRRWAEAPCMRCLGLPPPTFRNRRRRRRAPLKTCTAWELAQRVRE